MTKQKEDIDKKVFALAGQHYEHEGKYKKAKIAYETAGKYKDAKRVEKKERFAEEITPEHYQGIEQVLYFSAKVIMILSSFGLIFSLFSKPAVLSAQEIQLAPPLPNYMIFVLLGLLVISAVYLFIMKNRKKSRIPLSF